MQNSLIRRFNTLRLVQLRACTPRQISSHNLKLNFGNRNFTTTINKFETYTSPQANMSFNKRQRSDNGGNKPFKRGNDNNKRGNDNSKRGNDNNNKGPKKSKHNTFLDRSLIEEFNPTEFRSKSRWDWSSLFAELDAGTLAAPASFAEAYVQSLIKRSEDPAVKYTGATQFMQKSVTPCFGRLKAMHSDFIVQEIGEDGVAVQLVSTDLPTEDVIFNDADKRKEIEVSRLPEVTSQIESLLTEAGFAEFDTFVRQIKDIVQQKIDARARIEDLRVQQMERNAALSPEEREARFRAYAQAKQDSAAPVDEIDAEILKNKEIASQVFPQMIVDSMKDPFNKESRKQFHSLIREGFASLLLTDTVDFDFPQPDGTVKRGSAIRISSTKGDVNRHAGEQQQEKDNVRGGRGDGRDKKVDLRSIADGKWPGGENNYVQFALYKRGMDSNNAIDFLARQFRTAPWNIGYCGMKDKRAITVQWMTMHRMSAHRLRNAFIEYDRHHFLQRRLAKIDRGDCSFDPLAPIVNYQFSEDAHDAIPDMMVGNFKYVKNELKIGGHRGNAFQIRIRNVRPIVDTVDAPVTSLLDAEVTPFASINTESTKLRAQAAILSASTEPLTTEEMNELETTINKSCEKLTKFGFLNYFGTQRFGSFQIPSHVFGVAAVKSEFSRLFHLSMLNLQTNSPHLIADLENGEAVKAYMSMRPSFTRERSMLQHLIEQSPTDYKNAYFSGPRLTRSIFLHSYQSWIFNLMLSARMDPYFWDAEGKTDVYVPMVGDLVLENPKEIEGSSSELIGVARALTQEDIDSGKFTLGDLVMPILRDIRSLPKNKVSEIAHAVLKADGIPPEDLAQSLGSFEDESKRDFIYRPMICMPQDFTHTLTRGEDGLVDLKLKFGLRPSAYATMLLREVLHSSLYTFYEEQRNIQVDIQDAVAPVDGDNDSAEIVVA